MNEYSLIEILEEVHRIEFAEFDNPSKHYFSLRHRRNMKRILSQKCENISPVKTILSPKTAAVVLLIVFLALITGAIIVLKLPGFSGTVYPDNTQMFAFDDNAKKTIENIYYLEAPPNNYILTENNGDLGDDLIRYVYINPNSNDELVFEQYAKSRYQAHFDNEHNTIASIEIDGLNEFIWKAKDPNKYQYITIVWDTGDYILSIWGILNEKEAVNLSKSAKIL